MFWDPTVLTLNQASSGFSADILAGNPSILFDNVDVAGGSLTATFSLCPSLGACNTVSVFNMYDLVFDTAAGTSNVDVGLSLIGDVWWDSTGFVELDPQPILSGATVTVNAVPVPPPVIDDSATVSDDAVIGDGSTVGAGAVIARGVTIGEGSSIGPNVTINKDVTLGGNAVIGEGSTIHKEVMAGDDLTVGVNVTIHKNVMIGMNVTIGDNSQIHSHTVIGSDAHIGMIGGGIGVFVGNRVTIPNSKVIGDGEVIPNDTVVSP